MSKSIRWLKWSLSLSPQPSPFGHCSARSDWATAGGGYDAPCDHRGNRSCDPTQPLFTTGGGKLLGTRPLCQVRRSKRVSPRHRGATEPRRLGTPISDLDESQLRIQAFLSRGNGKRRALPAQIDSGAGDPGIRYASDAPGGTAGRAIISGPPDVGSYAGVHRARMDATR